MYKHLYLLFIGFIISLNGQENDWEKFKNNALRNSQSIHGWCNLEKSKKMMDLIYEVHPKICVEIGVFSGGSIYPTAKALSYLREGIVYAIDPWSTDASLQGYSYNDSNYLWWSKIDFESQFHQFIEMLKVNHLLLYCNPLRLTSNEAAALFHDNSIDILHIDGNHSTEGFLNDVQQYFPKVKNGGYIWLNDADWPSAIHAVIYLSDNAEWDADRSISNKCFLFRKRLQDEENE